MDYTAHVLLQNRHILHNLFMVIFGYLYQLSGIMNCLDRFQGKYTSILRAELETKQKLRYEEL